MEKGFALFVVNSIDLSQVLLKLELVVAFVEVENCKTGSFDQIAYLVDLQKVKLELAWVYVAHIVVNLFQGMETDIFAAVIAVEVVMAFVPLAYFAAC